MTAASVSSPVASPAIRLAGPDEPWGVLATDLARLAALIARLDDAAFRAAPVGAFESSIGHHVRHCLDHVHALLVAAEFPAEDTALDYDDRRRGTQAETDRAAALTLLSSLQRRALSMRGSDPLRPLRVRVLLTRSGLTAEVQTSLGRELTFVLGHATHHHAIIAAMARTMGVEVPADFGVAASTAAFREKGRCDRTH